MIEITINNKKYNVENNLTILQACEKADIVIPRFCYHDKLSVAGNCRMCLVEVEKSPKPVASCAMPLMPNMVIYTETPLVKKSKRGCIRVFIN
jgi:NADH dehydrogenase/NADH:ubiquinone oxidoreductase subunit G